MGLSQKSYVPADCRGGSRSGPRMWSKDMAARKGICASLPAMWSCLAGDRINVPADLSGPAGAARARLSGASPTPSNLSPKAALASGAKKIAARRGTG